MAQQLMKLTMRMWVRSLVLLSGLMIWRCCELCCRSQMWLGSRIAMALAQAGGYSSNWTPRWEPPYATSEALKRQKDKKKLLNLLSQRRGNTF